MTSLKNRNSVPIKSRFFKYYKNIICTDLLLKQNLATIMQLAKLEKINLTATSKIIINDKKQILFQLAALELLCGQKLSWTSAHKSIAGFKVRQNQLIGCKLTVRKNNMFSLFEKLVTVILPRIRDFRGLKKNFIEYLKEEKNYKKKRTSRQPITSYSLGFDKLLVSPELENYFEFFDKLTGFNSNIVIKSKYTSQSLLLLSGFQFPVPQKRI
jgi:large subunit ribosomal protein L5